jgi:hypothetical protein
MKQENKGRDQTMAKKTKETDSRAALLEMAEKALKSYEQTLGTGLKLQQEAAEWFSKSLQQAISTPNWQKLLADILSSAGTVFPAAQKQLEEALHLLEQNNRHCVDLIKKAAEVAQTHGVVESQAKWIDAWKASLTTARANAEALAAANAKMVDSCINFVKQSSRISAQPAAKAV